MVKQWDNPKPACLLGKVMWRPVAEDEELEQTHRRLGDSVPELELIQVEGLSVGGRDRAALLESVELHTVQLWEHCVNQWMERTSNRRGTSCRYSINHIVMFQSRFAS